MSKSKPLFLLEEKKSILYLSFILFFRLFGVFVLLPIFSILAFDLQDATPALIGLALGIYGLSQGLLQIPFGIFSDKWGRKKILFLGLFLFLFGCLLAAYATDIYTMIIARFIQGLGAVSSTIFAMIGDNTRSEVRTRANAFLGLGAGLAFGIAFCLAPFIGEILGLKGIFIGISITILICMFFVFIIEEKKKKKNTLSVKVLLRQSLQNKDLYTVYLGAFIVSSGLTATFFLIPIIVNDMGWSKIELWKLYIPLLIVSAFVMFPSTFLAEAKKKYKSVMIFGTVLILCAMLVGILYFITKNISYVFIFLYLFFIGFNIFEPLFPSLVTKLSDENTKGGSSGIYNFCQFIGQFFGASLMGFFYTDNPILPLIIFTILIIIYFIFLLKQDFIFPKIDSASDKIEPS